MTAAIEAHDITMRYGSRTAVDGLTFTAAAGEILGVLGPNGAGKTTAIRILTTMLEPTQGTFTVAGVHHGQPAGIRRVIGVLPERSGYPGQQTADEYLRYHARLYGQTRASARAVAIAQLERVGLADRSGSRIATFSRGMRQRLGIARALVNRPRVVFLDEPTLGLDPAGQAQVLDLVRSISAEDGATVLVSTHLLSEVEETCTRIVILHRGRLVAEGTVEEIAGRAAAQRRASLRVDGAATGRAVSALRKAPGVAHVEPATRRGVLTVTLGDNVGPRGGNDALRALAAAQITVLSFELEGARLSDAFLELTESP